MGVLQLCCESGDRGWIIPGGVLTRRTVWFVHWTGEGMGIAVFAGWFG